MTDHGTGPVLRRLEDGILTITLNRPESLNAINGELTRQLADAIATAAADTAVKVVVLTGAGAAFCAGGDMRSLDAPRKPAVAGRPDGAPLARIAGDLAGRLHRMAKPTIAMIRGPVAGGGLALALACDMRVASERSKYTFAYTKIGLAGDFGAAYFTYKVLGHVRAREFCLLCPRLDALEALQIGLVNRVVADTALEAETYALARTLALGPPLAYAAVKENLDAAADLAMDEAFAREAQSFMDLRETRDHKRSVRAFIEKQAPHYTGE